MKKNIIISLFLIVLISVAYTYIPKKTIIRGQISGALPNEIAYTMPISGVCNPNFKESMTVNSLGQFTIEVRITKPSFLNFVSTQKHCFIIEPGKAYYVEFLGKKATVENPSNAQLLYSSLPQECLQTFNTKEITDCAITNQCFDDQLHREMQRLDSEYAKCNISKKEYELIKAERQVYYKTFQAMAFVQHYTLTKDDISVNTQQLERLWSNAMVDLDLSDPILLQTSNFYDFLDYYLWGELYTSVNSKSFLEQREMHKNNNTTHTENIKTAEKLLPKSYLEYYTASYLSRWSKQEKNRSKEEFLSLEEQFRNNYPHSVYAHFFEDNVTKMAINLRK